MFLWSNLKADAGITRGLCPAENYSSWQKAEKLGAKIVGLGAFTAVVGDAGITVARNLNIPVTTGNSYTVLRL